MVGEWAFASTLLRQAVASGAERYWLGDDELTDARRPQAAQVVSRRIAASATRDAEGWADRWIIAVSVRFLAALLHDRLPVIARTAPWRALILMAAAPAIVWTLSPPSGAAVLFAGILVVALAATAGHATGIGYALDPWLPRFRNLAALASLAALLWLPTVDHVPLVLAIGLVSITMLAVRLRNRADVAWLADVTGHIVVIGIGTMFGSLGLVVGLAVATAHAFASLAALQSTLSRDLTQIR